jgi:ABC-2 type transport system ATP-binding protein
MQQKAQTIATLLHEPDLVIIDEPFTGLYPINTRMVKDLLRELADRGVSVIMSTHQMHQVEEMCDRILLIDQGRALLYGPIGEIRQRFSENAVLVRSPQALPEIEEVTRVEVHNAAYRLVLAPGVSADRVLQALVARHIPLEYFEIAAPTLDKIFVQVVQGGVEKE